MRRKKALRSSRGAFRRTAWLLSLLLLSCSLPGRIATSLLPAQSSATSTPIIIPTFTPGFTPLPTLTDTPIPTASLTPTPTITPLPSLTSTGLPATPVPSLTARPNQITSGNQIWTLRSVDFPSHISALGRLYSPPTRRDPLISYAFLRMNFDCSSGDTLIKLYAGSDLGLSFIHKQVGYPDLSIEDMQGSKYLVTLLGTCWLAAPIPRARINDAHFQLNFKDLPPFRFSIETSIEELSEQICFVSDRDGTTELFVMQPDGSDPLRLTTDFSRASEPSWSYDRSFIAYVTQRQGNADIAIVNLLGERIGYLSPSLFAEGGPAWSPVDDRILFHTQRDGNWEIYLASSREDEAANLSRSAADDMYPSWSPDAKRIAFQSRRDGNWEIYQMSAEGGAPTRLTNDPADDILPSWSPDGSRLVFWSKRGGTWRLYGTDLNTGLTTMLTEYENPGPAPSRAVWSPDGKEILLALLREKYLQLFSIPTNGDRPTQLTNLPANSYNPGW